MKIAISELELLREEVKNCHQIIKDLQKKREFVGLTEDEFYAVIRPFYGTDESCHAAMRISLDEYKAIEAKLKEKNT